MRKKENFWITFLDKQESRNNLRKWNKIIKKVYSKYLPKDKRLIEMYLSIQKKVFLNFDKGGEVGTNNHWSNVIFNQAITTKVFELNREFILLNKGKYFDEFSNSLTALTRKIIEIYIYTIGCRKDFKRIEKILTTEKNELDCTSIIKNLKNNDKFIIPYVRNLGKDKFLDLTLDNFRFFSNFFHLSGKNLSQTNGTLDETKNPPEMIPFTEEDKSNRTILSISSKKISPIGLNLYQKIIHDFYIYTAFILEELDLMKNNSKHLKN